MRRPLEEHLDNPEAWYSLLELLIEDIKSRAPERSNHGAHPEAWDTLMKWLRIFGLVALRRSFDWKLNAEDMEDILMEVVGSLQSVELLKRIRRTESPSGYIATMIVNAGRNAYRAKVRGSSRDSAWHMEWKSDRESVPTQDEENEKSRRIRRLGEVMKELSAQERKLLRMIFWEKLVPEQIARRLSVDMSIVYSRTFRLMRKLRGLF